MNSLPDVIRPRSKFDRQLARIEQQVVWENASASVRDNIAATCRLADLAESALMIGNADGATPTIKLRALAVARDCIATAADIRTKTIIDRTIPALSRTEITAAIAALPLSSGEQSEADASDPVAAERNRLRAAMARFSMSLVERDNAGSDRAAG